ncbi:MAG: hypothetical protein MUF50_05050, partial [Planctomycetes bacterium]|nr:hypothetical protein [Planctomycetota bacterium]
MNETEKIIEPSKLAKSDNIYSAKRTTEILPKNIYDQFEFAVGNTNPITYAVRIIRFPIAGKKVLKIEIGKLQTISKGLLKTTPLNINNYFTKFLDTIVSILDDVINDPLIQQFQGILISFDKSVYESITTRAKFQNTLLKMSRRLYKIYSYVIELDEKHNMYALYKKNLSFDAVFDEDYIINTLTDIGSIDWSGADNSQKRASTKKEEPPKIVTPKSKIKTPDISVGAPLDNEKIISNVSNAINTKLNTEVVKPVQPPQPKKIGTSRKTFSERLNSQQTMDSPAGKAALKFFCMSDLFSKETNKLFSMTEEELSSAIWFKNKHKEKLIDYLENDFLIMPVIHYLWSEGFEYIERNKNPSVRFSSPYHMIRKIAAKHPLKILDEPKKLT